MKIQSLFLISLFGLCTGLSHFAFAQTPRGVPIPVVTRFVKIFSEFEAQVDKAARSGDQAKLDELLADDFEVRTGAAPGDPIPRADWISQYAATSGEIPEFKMEQVAARELSGAAVVSYRWPTRGTAGFLVVDVWVGQGDTWKLTERYSAPVGGSHPVVPGTASKTVKIRKKI